LFPVLARLWGTDNASFKRTVNQSIGLVVVAGVPISLVTVFNAREIVELFYGTADFAPSIVVLQIFAVCMLLVYIDFVLGSALMSADKQKDLSMISFLAIFVNVVFNAFAIPYTAERWDNGGIGAAVATGITELFVMVMMLRQLPSSGVRGMLTRLLGKVGIAGAVAATALVLLAWTPIPWIAGAIVSGLLYGVCLVILRTFRPEDYALIEGIPKVGPLAIRLIPQRYRKELRGE